MLYHDHRQSSISLARLLQAAQRVLGWTLQLWSCLLEVSDQIVYAAMGRCQQPRMRLYFFLSAGTPTETLEMAALNLEDALAVQSPEQHGMN